MEMLHRSGVLETEWSGQFVELTVRHQCSQLLHVGFGALPLTHNVKCIPNPLHILTEVLCGKVIDAVRTIGDFNHTGSRHGHETHLSTAGEEGIHCR